jgi:hypothetical protein
VRSYVFFDQDCYRSFSRDVLVDQVAVIFACTDSYVHYDSVF